MFSRKAFHVGVCGLVLLFVGVSTPAQAWYYHHRPHTLFVEPVLPFQERVVIERPYHQKLERRILHLDERIAVLDERLALHPYNRDLRIERSRLLREKERLLELE